MSPLSLIVCALPFASSSAIATRCCRSAAAGFGLAGGAGVGGVKGATTSVCAESVLFAGFVSGVDVVVVPVFVTVPVMLTVAATLNVTACPAASVPTEQLTSAPAFPIAHDPERVAGSPRRRRPQSGQRRPR